MVKKKEKEIPGSKQIDDIADRVAITDLQGKIVDVNRALLAFLGLRPEEIVGRNILDLVVAEDRERGWKSFKETIERGFYSNLEIKGISPLGKESFSEVNGLVIRDADGRPLKTVAIIHDVTHRKKIEQKLAESEEMYRNLLDNISEAVYKTDAEGTLLFISAGIERIIGYKPDEVVGRTRKEITISARLEPELWTVEIDRVQIEQVLLNLLVNAWQAMPQGGEIAIESQNLELLSGDAHAYQVRPGRFVRMTVSDSGIGMDEEIKSRIFDPFFTTKEIGRGTGLGLASAYGILKNHGGVITVYSEKGRGGTFHVYLPASDKAVETSREPVEAVIGGHETILLIDDEEVILDVARQMLENLGYKVLAAENGSQALDAYGRNRQGIDLVILDMIMPKMGGGMVFETLKGINPDVRILLSSGYSINGQAMDIMSQGCRGFIQKPFSIKELALKLREILDT